MDNAKRVMPAIWRKRIFELTTTTNKEEGNEDNSYKLLLEINYFEL